MVSLEFVIFLEHFRAVEYLVPSMSKPIFANIKAMKNHHTRSYNDEEDIPFPPSQRNPMIERSGDLRVDKTRSMQLHREITHQEIKNMFNG